MPKKIDFGSDENFIKNYEQLKSSRKMAELYHCNKTSILNHVKMDDSFNFSVFKHLNYSLKYNEDELRSVNTGLITNSGSFARQYPYRETDFYEFDKFLFKTWRNRHDSRKKDQLEFGDFED